MKVNDRQNGKGEVGEWTEYNHTVFSEIEKTYKSKPKSELLERLVVRQKLKKRFNSHTQQSRSYWII